MASHVIHLKPSEFRFLHPVFNHVQVSIKYVHMLTVNQEPSATIDEPSPRPWFYHMAREGEGSNIVGIDSPAVIEAKVPIAVWPCLASSTRSPKRYRYDPRNAGQPLDKVLKR